MSEHVVPLKVYYKTFAFLMFLLLITVGAAFIHIGATGNIILAMTIAVVKMTAIILFFMHVYYSSKLVQVFAACGFVWLVILLAFFMGDYFTRVSQPKPWSGPAQPAAVVQTQTETPAQH